jgi:3D (Asp-Asp-Asp) domain-containing protein
MVQSAKSHMTKYKVVERFTAMTAIAAMLVGMIPVQAVNAQTNEIVASNIPYAVVNTSTLLREDFPVAGEREAPRTRSIVATSYSSDPYQTDSTPCLPAMNYDLCEHAMNGEVNTIAANDLPLGTQVRFPELYGDTVFVVRDRMNRRYTGKSRIDFYVAKLDADGNVDNVASKQNAINFGVKRLKMEIF